MQKHPLISINLSIGRYSDFVENIRILSSIKDSSEYICVANVHMLVEAYNDKEFASAVNNSAITTPDGVPLTWALNRLYGIKQERVAGMDLLPDLLSLSSEHSIPIFFYGGPKKILSQTKEYVKTYYPKIPFTGVYSPPFRPLTVDEECAVTDKINTSGARIIFVSLGCPKQEKWMASMKGRINGVMIGIGGALPVLLGVQKRAPQWMRKCGLEWLFRLLQEPKRLFKRYFYTNTKFIYLILREKIKGKRLVK
jgi:N-acetylglucosaminyldiphosphoundecaprenol N-acetyl-beta-D-mannosaminyltransferase